MVCLPAAAGCTADRAAAAGGCAASRVSAAAGCATDTAAAAAARTPKKANAQPASGSSILIGLPAAGRTQKLCKSTVKVNRCKKSAPSKGKASKNHQRKTLPPKFTATVRQPQHSMGWLLAEEKAGPVGGSADLCGNTPQRRAPKRPGRLGCAETTAAAQPISFPQTDTPPGSHTFWHPCHTCGGASRKSQSSSAAGRHYPSYQPPFPHTVNI
jgi:hypothetical protein